MKRSRFNEEQIIAILKEQEAGMATTEVCRRHGISGRQVTRFVQRTAALLLP
ncbi:MAG: transposase [Erythrobacter sp.]|jgi:putative transposase|uniref:transposase n=1 Tax=Erythrobacter sp. TaxID=1042 RepID=UPI002B48F245|nr:transposase [Erythrobacter sp.]WRH70145.1 MAG: transposase [Erythrobacter sp.]